MLGGEQEAQGAGALGAPGRAAAGEMEKAVQGGPLHTVSSPDAAGAGEAGPPGDAWRMGCTGTGRKAWRAVGRPLRSCSQDVGEA